MRAPLRLTLAVCVCACVAAPAAHAASTPATVSLCRPGTAGDPCAPGQATTRFTPAGQALGVAKDATARHARIDCFYVYPTVSDQHRLVASRAIDPPERSVALYQAARYSRVCRVFAPVYRQYTLQALDQPSGKVHAGFVSRAG
jgi:Protein of unknown function (DUF3089)